MKDEQSVLIGVSVNNQSVSDLANLKKQIDDLRAAQKSLDRTTEEGRKQYEAMGAQIKSLTSQYNEKSKVLQNEIKQQEAAKDSLAAYSAELATLTKQYKQLSAEERNSKVGKDMQKRMKELTNTLKEAEAAYGNNTRNVGNYRDALTLFGKTASGALGGVLTSLKNLSAAMLTNPIGAIITALVATVMKLKEAFTESDSAMTALSRGMAAFQPIIDLINKALVRAVDGLAKFVNKVVDFAGKLSPAVKASAEFAEQQDRLEETLRAHSTLYEQNATKLAELNQKMRDSTLTLTERNKAAQEYIDILKEQARVESADKLEQFRQEWQKLINTTGRGGEQLKEVYGDLNRLVFEGMNEESILRIQKALEDTDWSDSAKDQMTSLLKEYQGIQSKLISESRVATNTINRAYSDAADKARKRVEKANQALEEGLGVAEEYGKTLGKQIEESEKPVEDLSEAYIRLVDAIANSAYTQQALESVMKKLNTDYKEGKVSLESYTESMNQLLVLQERLNDIENDEDADEANKKDLEAINKRKEATQQAIDQAVEYAEAATDIINDLFEYSTERQKEQIESALQTQLDALDSERDALDAKLQAGYISEAQYNAKVKKLDEEREKAQAEATYKTQLLEWKNSLLQAAINVAMAITKAVAQSPMTGGLPGSAIAAATGAVQLGIIGAKKPEAPKFGNGGIITGPSHKQGGVLLEAEGGEAIINKKSTAKYASLLSAINQAGGGVAIPSKGNGIFAKGGIVNDGGYSIKNPQREMLKNFKVYTTIEDIRRADKEYTEVTSYGKV